MTTKPQELERCPFCGGKPSFIIDADEYLDDHKNYYIRCSGCKASTALVNAHTDDGCYGRRRAYELWNTRSPTSWVACSEKLPQNGKHVLIHYKNAHGKTRRVVGIYARPTSGWYEYQDNWDDYAYIFVNNGEVTHWMPLPPPPTEVNEGDRDER